METARSEPPPAAPSNEVTLAELTGRFVLADGSPAANVSLKLTGSNVRRERTLDDGATPDWNDVETQTGNDGSVSIRFAPPLAYDFWLHASLHGYGDTEWSWRRLTPGSKTDLGVVTMRAAGTIKGRVVDAHGDLLRGKVWEVAAFRADGDLRVDADSPFLRDVTAVTDPDTAEFVLEDVAAGKVSLSVRSGGGSETSPSVVDVIARETSHVDIVYDGADLSRRISVTLFNRPFELVHGNAKSIFLLGPDGSRREAEETPGRSQDYHFDDVPPGTYTIEIKDPRFLPWKKNGVSPGDEVEVWLEGNAAIKLTVTDGTSGEVIPRYSLIVRFTHPEWFPNAYQVLGDGNEVPDGGLFHGMIPVEQSISVRAKGYASTSIDLQRLEPDETRVVTARLVHGATLCGTVLEADRRTPAPNILVHLEENRHVEDAGDEKAYDERLASFDSSSDGSGRFSFTSVSPGNYVLRTGPTSRLQVQIDKIEVQPGSGVLNGLDLVLPANGLIAGRLVGPPGSDYSRLQAEYEFVDADSSVDAPLFQDDELVRQEDGVVHDDGTFRLGPVPAGDAKVLLRLPEIRSPAAPNAFDTHDGPTIELGQVVVPSHGTTNVEFRLDDRFPGRLRVGAKLRGQPAAEAVVDVFACEAREDRKSGSGEAESDSVTATEPRILASGILDAAGSARIGPIPVGQVRVLVRALNHSWAYWVPDAVSVTASGVARSDCDFTLIDGTVVITDGQGQLAPGGRLRLGHDVGRLVDYSVWVDLDEHSAVRLRLAPGRYHLSATGDGSDQGTLLDWTEKGPVQSKLAVGD